MASLKLSIRKFDLAARALACSDRSLHDRLDEAIEEISSLSERDFNPDLRKGFIEVMDAIHDYRESGDRPDLQAGTALSILEECISLHRDTWE